MDRQQWANLLFLLVSEVLAALRDVARSSFEKPFRLGSRQWIPILTATYVRLGWVSENASSERAVKAQIVGAISALHLQNHPVLTFEQAVSIFQRIVETSSPNSSTDASCPPGMLRDAEFRILRQLHLASSNAMLQACHPSDSSRKGTCHGSECNTLVLHDSMDPSSPQSIGSARDGLFTSSRGKGRRLSVSTISSVSGHSEMSFQQSPRQSPQQSPRQSPRSGESESDSAALVSHMLDGGAGSMPLGNLPSLPCNLDDMSRHELKKVLVDQHAQWMRTANQLVASQGDQRSTKLEDFCENSNKRKFNTGSQEL